jgi:putative ABC transport system permease protein
LALVTGILVLFSSILSTFRQRRYETILMKVIGVTPKMIGNATKMEFFILGMAAGALALIIGSLASYMVIVFIMNFPWVWSLSISLSIILASLFITFLFAFWALSKILNAKPSNFLRNE